LADVLTAKKDGASRTAALAVYTEWNWNHILTPRAVLWIIPIVALVLWTYPYWFPGQRWEATWSSESAWGHGYLIPFIAVLIASYRLKELAPIRLAPSAWGLVLILAGLVIRIWAQTLLFGYPAEVTFLLVVAGVVLLLMGWQALRVLWVPIAYLGLMIPWDQKYYEGISLPLQNLSAVVSERILSLLGMTIVREGNVLYPIGSPPVGVAHACSGLHLLLTFVALGVLMAFMYRRALWERLVIIGSSIPIAVFCNMIRVTLMTSASQAVFEEGKAVAAGTPGWSAYVPKFAWGLLASGGVTVRPPEWIQRGEYGYVPAALWNQFFTGSGLAEGLARLYENVMNPESYLHQSFGFAMLGLAFVLMWAELKLIDLIFVEEGPAGPAGTPAPLKATKP
jgi:exosortase